ncbi:hypothetical protein pSALSNUABM04_074 [Salmonella phage pSal-SNUABM-04]|nr:hypothetical protein pSALSNUABM04_074 [Salmonella phage pSal-SNUABM-04]
MTLLLNRFDLSPRYPTLRHDPKLIAEVEDIRLAVSEDPNGEDKVFVVIYKGQVISGVSFSKPGYPRDEDNQREQRNAAYTALSYASSYLMAVTPVFADRAVLVGRMVALYTLTNMDEFYNDDRITQRLQEDPRKAHNASDCKLDALALLSELYHVCPTFDNNGIVAQYENVKLNVLALWGIEKIRYKLTAKGGTYELTAYVDVGFEEDSRDTVDNFMSQFEFPLQSIPVDQKEEGEDE